MYWSKRDSAKQNHKIWPFCFKAIGLRASFLACLPAIEQKKAASKCGFF